MIFHSYIIDGWGHYAGIETYGWMGVDLFFVLSGYLIGSQVLKPIAAGQGFSFTDFYLRRAFRILPVYLLVVAVYFIWPSIREYAGIQPLWQFLTFTVNLFIDVDKNLAFSHVWSLCVEEHFYLLFPLLAWWLARRPSVGKLLVVCLAIVAFGMLVRGYIWQHYMGPAKGVDQNSYNKYFLEGIYYPTWSRLDGLLAGVVLAVIRTYRPAQWTRWAGRANGVMAAGFVVLGLAVWLFQDRAGFPASVLGYPLLSVGMGLIVFAGASAKSLLARARVPGAGWLALASYSLYLSHKLVFHLVESEMGDHLDGHGVLTFAGYAAAVLLVGALLHHGVERPFLRLRDRLLKSARTGRGIGSLASQASADVA